MNNYETARLIVGALLSQDVKHFERTITDAITTVRQILDEQLEELCTEFKHTHELTCKTCGRYPWEHKTNNQQ